jgi:hypothetical protein
MFGTQHSNQQSNDDPAMLDNVKQLAREPADSILPTSPPAVVPAQPSSPFTPTTVSSISPTVPPTVPPNYQPADEHRAEPAYDFSTNQSDDPIPDTTTSSSFADHSDDQTPVVTSEPDADALAIQADQTSVQEEASSVENSTTPVIQSPDKNHLASLKQQALEHLEPLADHVEGTPEEMFKTTMMMIQANDNHTLLEKALEAAKKIEDDKIRAKAMLDVINEINYLSQDNSAE